MRVLLAIFVGVFFAVPAFAQPTQSEPAPVVYEFGDEPVPGVYLTPSGSPVSVRQGRDRHSLIRPRAQLIDKLQASLESL